MKIEIKCYDDEVLVLSDEDLDNDNFVDLYIKKDDNKEIEVTVSVDELLCAVRAFNQQRFLRLKRDKLLSE